MARNKSRTKKAGEGKAKISDELRTRGTESRRRTSATPNRREAVLLALRNGHVGQSSRRIALLQIGCFVSTRLAARSGLVCNFVHRGVVRIGSSLRPYAIHEHRRESRAGAGNAGFRRKRVRYATSWEGIEEMSTSFVKCRFQTCCAKGTAVTIERVRHRYPHRARTFRDAMRVRSVGQT